MGICLVCKFKLLISSILRKKEKASGKSESLDEVVPAGVEPATHGFSIRCSTN